MKKTLVGFAVLSLVVALGFTLAPKEVEAAAPYLCTSYRDTPIDWGKGATCAAAEQNLIDLLTPVVNADCNSYPYSGTCGTTLVRSTCRDYHLGGKVIDGHMHYRCRFEDLDDF